MGSDFSGLTSADYNELLQSMDRGAMMTAGVIMLIIGALSCFLGYKLMKLYIAICGFLLGGVLGAAIGGAVLKSNGASILLFLVLGILCAIVSYKLYKVGVFFLSFLGTGLAAVAFLMGITKGEIDPKIAIVIGVVAGIIAGIVTVIITKPLIIVTSALGGGSVCGTGLSLLVGNPSLAVIFGIVFFVLGLIVQIKTNNGLLEHEDDKPASQNYRQPQYVNPYAADPGFRQYSENGGQPPQNGQGGDFFQSRPRQ